MLHYWHGLICGSQDDINTIGAYRTHEDPMQVVSGPIQKRVVHFEAPSSDRMNDEMNAFIDWFNTCDIPPLTKAGLAHLWFVSVHPYEDGNGRIARALAEKILAVSLGQPSLLALARTIEKYRTAYYDQLEANNQSLSVDDWIMWFAEICLEAQEYSKSLIECIIAKTKMLDELGNGINDRQKKVLIRMFDSGPEGFEGGLSAKNYMTITGATTATTTRDLRNLVEKDVLRRTGEQKGARYWMDT
jgi:Fic family protein